MSGPTSKGKGRGGEGVREGGKGTAGKGRACSCLGSKKILVTALWLHLVIIVLSSLHRGIQSPTEMLPFIKRGERGGRRCCTIVLTAHPVWRALSVPDAVVIIFGDFYDLRRRIKIIFWP